MDKHLHIIALNIPWPPNYGGVIDIYYKIKALHETGIKIILHCFEYERPPAVELENICEEIYYYKRKTGIISNMTLIPYNVYSRRDTKLLKNLLKDNYPILFEGLHSCYYLKHPDLRKRMKIFRECNIEHDYYYNLALSCNEPVKKLFFYLEAWRFKQYQTVVSYADLVLSVSITDKEYLEREFPGKKIEFIPCFHENNKISVLTGRSDFLLYHAKLSVYENERAALYLIENVFNKLNHTCILAGMDPTNKIVKAAGKYPNIRIEANPTKERMDFLIQNAQIHTLTTFQDTGLKLKLLNSLFRGRHIVVNKFMLAGSGLENACHIADTPTEIIEKCNDLMDKEIDKQEVDNRKKLLLPLFSNPYQAEHLCRLIFEK